MAWSEEEKWIIDRLSSTGSHPDPTVSWPHLLACAREHGVSPLIHEHLDSSVVSGDVVEEFQKDHVATYVYNASMEKELADIGRCCTRAGIEVMLLKGADLVQRLYANDPSLRRLTDIDIYVRGHDYDTFSQVIQKLGYELYDTTDILFRKPPFVLDIHNHPSRLTRLIMSPGIPAFPITEDWLFGGATQAGAGLCLPQAEKAFVLYALHFSFVNGFHGLKWAYDLLQMLRNPDFITDKSVLRRTASEVSADQWMACVFTYLAQVFNVPKISCEDALLNGAQQRFLQRAAENRTDGFDRYLLPFFSQAQTRFRFRLFLKLLFPGRQFLEYRISRGARPGLRDYLKYYSQGFKVLKIT